MGLASGALREAGHFGECDTLLAVGSNCRPIAATSKFHFELKMPRLPKIGARQHDVGMSHQLWPDDNEIRNYLGAAFSMPTLDGDRGRFATSRAPAEQTRGDIVVSYPRLGLAPRPERAMTIYAVLF